jgi:hypothetical protein
MVLWFPGMEKKLTNSGPLMESTSKHSIYPFWTRLAPPLARALQLIPFEERDRRSACDARSLREEPDAGRHKEETGDPPREDREASSIQLGPVDLPQHIPSLDHPVPRDVSHDRRQDDHADAPDEHVPQEDDERRQHDHEDEDLSDLDADIEGEQRN